MLLTETQTVCDTKGEVQNGCSIFNSHSAVNGIRGLRMGVRVKVFSILEGVYRVGSARKCVWQ